MKILLADDNPEVRSALRLLLEQEPIQAMVIEVVDAQSLLAQLSENCPLVVLLDWELPKLHNSDFLIKVRSRCPETRVIALSSKFEARQAARDAGVDAFVGKAEPPEKILSTLCSFLPQQQNK
jgi:DNA-binding NarL/FixJ family response regulator